MAEYELTLDDGELWLPSEIMADVGLRHHCPYHHQYSSVPSLLHRHRGPIDVEELASGLAAFGLLPGASVMSMPALRPHQGIQPEGPPARFWPAREREAQWARLIYQQLLRPTKPAAPFDGRRLEGGWRPALPGQSGPSQSAQWQTETVGRFQQRLPPPRPPRPVQSRGGGTGVFLPRVVAAGGGQAPAKKQRGGREQQPQQAWNKPAPAAALGRGTAFLPPSASCLPPDWTY